MRAGPLSSPKIIETLNRDFVNVRILAKTLGPLAENASSSAVRRWAARLRDDYTYPVDSIIYGPGAQKLVNVPTNELMQKGNMDEAYLRFLEEGLQAWSNVAGQ